VNINLVDTWIKSRAHSWKGMHHAHTRRKKQNILVGKLERDYLEVLG
jgi:hypothetical protein